MRVLTQLSLTQRLTLMFVAAATAVLLTLGFVIASSVEQHFEDLDMEVLSGKMELIRDNLQSVSGQDGLTPFAHQLARSLVGHNGLEVMVIGPDLETFFATQFAGFDPALVVNQAMHAARKPVRWQLNGHSYRVIAAHLPTAAVDMKGEPLRIFVAVATNMGHHQTYMQSFLNTLWMFVVGAAGLTGLLGWAAVRQGLAPLHTMRTQAQVVTAQQLSQRLVVESMPVELAELAQSLNDMLARLEVAFTRLADFSSDIAHELRTPVSNLMTQTQVALSRERDAAAYRSILESNAEELEHMTRMISDMLLLARSENGLTVPTATALDLATEVRSLYDYYDAVAEDKGLKLTLNGNATVVADRVMLRRALGNLLSNAIRHSTPHAPLLVDIRTEGETVLICLENTGEVIPPEYLERIFDRFFRVDASRQRGEGTGLGLAIAKSIVVAHGGSIAASSFDGLTRFTVKLPKAMALQ